ncbi:MAG: hypothetical protein JOS17DRAFT_791944 [Linnemannia elongata]|nr:MAG: hypothetical protein JOS17DRAFT_791944 [Linnemannia elongata]
MSMQTSLPCGVFPDDNLSSSIKVDALGDKTQLNNPRTRLSKLFPESPDDNTYIIFQPPPPAHAPVPSRALTPLPGSLSDGSRSSTPICAFVRGDKKLPVTKGSIRGLPNAWRPGFGKAPETRPRLLSMDLPDASTPDSPSRNLAAGSILEFLKEDNRHPYFPYHDDYLIL